MAEAVAAWRPSQPSASARLFSVAGENGRSKRYPGLERGGRFAPTFIEPIGLGLGELPRALPQDGRGEAERLRLDVYLPAAGGAVGGRRSGTYDKAIGGHIQTTNELPRF